VPGCPAPSASGRGDDRRIVARDRIALRHRLTVGQDEEFIGTVLGVPTRPVSA
jgi:hypothetical protein